MSYCCFVFTSTQKHTLYCTVLYCNVSDPDPDFMFLSSECSLLRAEGFPCSLKVLFVCLLKKISIFSAVNFFPIFGHQSPGSGLDPDPDSDRYSAKNAGSGSVFSLKCRIRTRTQWIRIRNTSVPYCTWDKFCTYWGAGSPSASHSMTKGLSFSSALDLTLNSSSSGGGCFTM